MQLAKNLWLNREKTISRKIQEAFLTIYLEQELSKEKILELYMNIVEFGPNVYGIKEAAKYYFDTTPWSLTFAQSLFLASILPKPNASYFGADGKVHTSRMFYLHRIMKAMREKNKISEEEYQTGIREILVFRKPSTRTNEREKIEAKPNGIDPDSWD
jgi:membrane peptidoglycan carboxypeptidase